MKLTLIYATRPELKPLAFVKDPEDVREAVVNRLTLAYEKEKGRAEEAKEAPRFDEVATLWRYARAVEIELDDQVPTPWEAE